MTNLLATLIITTITNWTGYTTPDGKEAGIVFKQHTASIEYKGKTNTMVLLTEPTKLAVYREQATNSITVVTNWIPFGFPPYSITNTIERQLFLNKRDSVDPF